MRKSEAACAIRASQCEPFPAQHEIHGYAVLFDTRKRIGEQCVTVSELARMNLASEQATCIFRLLLDDSGKFYGVERIEKNKDEGGAHSELVTRLDGKQAMLWLANHFIPTGPMRRQFIRAIENPVFEFMPMVPEGPKRRKRRAAKKANGRPMAVQMEMATALVSVIQKLDADPRPETLAEARRNVSRLHRDLHSEETFKAVANG